jgi:hypothetical protein
MTGGCAAGNGDGRGEAAYMDSLLHSLFLWVLV